MARKRVEQKYPQQSGVYYTPPAVYIVGSAAVIAVCLTVVVLAFLFYTPVLYGGAGLALVGGGWMLSRMLIDWSRARQDKQDREQARRLRDIEIARSQFLPIARTDGYIDVLSGIYHAPAIGPGGGPAVVDGQAVEVEPTRADTMQVLAESDCVFVQGGRGAGKTNIMLWWMASKRRGEKIVCDPKGTAVNPWPGCRVVSDDAAIEYTVRRIAAEARRRKTKELFNEPPIYLLVDELHYLVEDNDERPGLDIARHVFAVISLGRQYNVHASFTTSDGGVKSLGIEGRGGLRDGLTWIEMAQHPVTRMRECWIRHSRYGRIEATLPPVYNGIGSSKPLRLPASVTTPQPVEVESDIKRCPVCGEPVESDKATYCSPACRQRAYRDRVT